MSDQLLALSPLDGRYQAKLIDLAAIFSEYGLIKNRVKVELAWLQHLTSLLLKTGSPPSRGQASNKIDQILQHFDLAQAEQVKTIERTTNHDVKAVEYYLREQLNDEALTPYIHILATSEDINNIAYALMLKEAREQVLVPKMQALVSKLDALAKEYDQLQMLSRTHGQPATPTTLGKELKNFAFRLQRQLEQFKQQPLLAKFNGAVGNFHAHKVAFPEQDWPAISKAFIESLGLTNNPYTTQIEPHDFIAEIMHEFVRFNTIVIDCARDLWSYISLNYFSLRKIENEVGSSTMPHKINPIDFENAEGNCGLAIAMAEHLANKLPISRFQRDLSDSTVMRNLGVVFGYSVLAFDSLLKGLNKLQANEVVITADLKSHPEVIAEAIQTVMRKHGITDAYEQLKTFSRGEKLDAKKITAFIKKLPIPKDEQLCLLKLTESF